MKPHRSRYWLNQQTPHQEVFENSTREISAMYATALARQALGERTVAVDEITGIQALDRLAPTQPPAPGLVERREFEYRRHGTGCLIANFDVASGQIISPTLGPTRTEADFAAHLARLLDTDPDARWVIMADNLNIHQSEAVVHLVAQRCGIPEDLGVKGRSGSLRSQASRAAFLQDYRHRIRLVYTPKHSSWLNQIEIWLSILTRRLLKRGHLTSIEDLQQQIRAFIEYYNQLWAKPFKWTYKGRPLTV